MIASKFYTRRTLLAFCVAISGAAISGASVAAEISPTYTLIEFKRNYGRASHAFRGNGFPVDYWFVGHDRSDGPFRGKAVKGTYAVKQDFELPTKSLYPEIDLDMDRHACGFLHLNSDDKIDMVCAVGANRGIGDGKGYNEVYRNDSTATQLAMTRIEGDYPLTNIEDMYGRGRDMVPFKFANGNQGVWSVVHGVPRGNGEPNINKLFEYNDQTVDGHGSFKFNPIPSLAINIGTMSSCAVAGDLNGDTHDDLLLCRPDRKDDANPESILYLQNGDSTFSEIELPTNSKRFVTAEIADVIGSDLNELIVSIEEEGEEPTYWIEIYKQEKNGETYVLKSTPTLRFQVPGRANSLAIGDLDGDGKPDIYAATSLLEICKKVDKPHLFMKDTWADIVLSTSGAEPNDFKSTELAGPADLGCSWLATWAAPGIIHLGRGTESDEGHNYSLKF